MRSRTHVTLTASMARGQLYRNEWQREKQQKELWEEEGERNASMSNNNEIKQTWRTLAQM